MNDRELQKNLEQAWDTIYQKTGNIERALDYWMNYVKSLPVVLTASKVLNVVLPTLALVTNKAVSYYVMPAKFVLLRVLPNVIKKLPKLLLLDLGYRAIASTVNKYLQWDLPPDLWSVFAKILDNTISFINTSIENTKREVTHVDGIGRKYRSEAEYYLRTFNDIPMHHRMGLTPTLYTDIMLKDPDSLTNTSIGKFIKPYPSQSQPNDSTTG